MTTPGGSLVIPTRGELPIAYRRACVALEKCAKLDECKKWADKARAIASYAKQADDETLHRHADRIKARAILRCGQLLKQIEPKRGARTDLGRAPAPSRKAAANCAGLSTHQAKQAVRVANVPAADFERQVESDRPPTITQLADQGRTRLKEEFTRMRGDSTPQQHAAAGAVIGDLASLSKTIKKLDAAEVAKGVRPTERPHVLADTKRAIEWLEAFTQALGDRT